MYVLFVAFNQKRILFNKSKVIKLINLNFKTKWTACKDFKHYTRCESLEGEGRSREERFSCLLQDLEKSAILARDRERAAAQLSADVERGRDEAAAARQQLDAANQELLSKQQLIQQLQALGILNFVLQFKCA